MNTVAGVVRERFLRGCSSCRMPLPFLKAVDGVYFGYPDSIRSSFSGPKMSALLEPTIYPEARRDDTSFTDFPFHQSPKIADPYRWMEDPDSSETREWVKRLNTISEPYISAAPSRELVRKKLTELWDFEKFSCTSKRGKYYYFSHNSGLQNQYVTYQQTDLCDKGKIFFDPNLLSADGTTCIKGSCWSHDGSVWAYALSEKGSDWMTIRFRTAEGVDLPDVITGAKFCTPQWTVDKGGIFYSKFPNHKSTNEGTSVEKHEYLSLYYHRMGTECKEDVLVFEDRSSPDRMVCGSVSEDGRFLIIHVSDGCDPHNLLYCVDLAKHGAVEGKLDARPLFDKHDAKYDYVDHDDDKMLIITNKDAPMFRLIRVDINDPSKQEVLISEDPRVKLEFASPVDGNKLLVSYIEDVKNTLYLHDLASGKRLYQLSLDIGTVSSVFCKKSLAEMFFAFESFLVPTIIYRIDFTGLSIDTQPEVKELRRVQLKGLDSSEFQTKQIFYDSKDGTKVPMYVLSRKDVVLDGNNPTLLYAYGGFNISLLPYCSVTRLLFAKYFGGVFAIANIRGGGEYGERWHEEGFHHKKQNCFDDFISAAEYLIREKYTTCQRLAIQGGSNGGLLVGAVSQQRPDLFGAVVNQVGVLDMLRFHKFTVGGAWVPEYGNPDKEEDFETIFKYSPLHNIRMPEAGQWPSTLLMTADHDDRVVPSHTLKYVAQLYHEARKHAAQRLPLLARIEVRAGHGFGKPTAKIISEQVDLLSFLQRTLDLQWKGKEEMDNGVSEVKLVGKSTSVQTEKQNGREAHKDQDNKTNAGDCCDNYENIENLRKKEDKRESGGGCPIL